MIDALRETKRVEGTTAAELQANFASLLNAFPTSQGDEGWYSTKLLAGIYTLKDITSYITNKYLY